MDFDAAKSYVTEKLNVEFTDNKAALLRRLVRAFLEKVPFQNITVSVLPVESRFPTRETVVKCGRDMKGGVSIHNNWFIKILLEALNYRVYFVAGYAVQPVATETRPLGSHIAVVVVDLTKKGELHLVDVEGRYPFFKPVPLCELPFEATDVTLTYRIVDEDGQWHREHEDPRTSCYIRYITYVKTRYTSLEFFERPIAKALTEDWLIGDATAVRYLQPNSKEIPSVPDFQPEYDYLLKFYKDTLAFENDSGLKYSERIAKDQIEFTLQVYFPTIPAEDIAKWLAKLAEAENESGKPWYQQCAVL